MTVARKAHATLSHHSTHTLMAMSQQPNPLSIQKKKKNSIQVQNKKIGIPRNIKYTLKHNTGKKWCRRHPLRSTT